MILHMRDSFNSSDSLQGCIHIHDPREVSFRGFRAPRIHLKVKMFQRVFISYKSGKFRHKHLALESWKSEILQSGSLKEKSKDEKDIKVILLVSYINLKRDSFIFCSHICTYRLTMQIPKGMYASSRVSDAKTSAH